MSRTIELPDALYEALQRVAAARGMTLEDWLAERLASEPPPRPANPDDTPAKTMADLFAGRVGVISSSGKETLSEDTGERFTDYVEEKRRAGTL